MLIASEGILYRGPRLSQLTAVWDYTQQKWVRNCFLTRMVRPTLASRLMRRAPRY
jgi:hypothetical protein